MGYMTNFTFTFGERNENKVRRFKEQLAKISHLSYETIDSMEDCPVELKWYNVESDIAAVCKDFPEIDFVLEGEGEDRYDWWVIVKRIGEPPIYKEATIINPFESQNEVKLI